MVIAIIAILAAILFPVFAKAREKARQTSCLSNIRQLGTAFHMYAQDYDETFPMPSYSAPDWSWVQRWDVMTDGSGALLDVNGGLITPYTKNGQIYLCPSSPWPNGVDSIGQFATGYGYNSNYVGGDVGNSGGWPFGTPASLGALASPAETVLLADSAIRSYLDPTAVIANNYLLSPEYYTNSGWGADYADVHFRHNEMANVAFSDGHAKAMPKKGTSDPNNAALNFLSPNDSLYDRQ